LSTVFENFVGDASTMICVLLGAGELDVCNFPGHVQGCEAGAFSGPAVDAGAFYEEENGFFD
jgi:hypothetical protein